MNVEIIVSLISLVGLVAAALMASLGYFYKIKREKKRTSRKVLYILLDIRFSVIRSMIDPSMATKLYLDHLISRFESEGVKADRSEVEGSIRGMVEEHIDNVIKSSVIDIDTRLLSEFEDALSLMAADNPIGSYHLRGKESIHKLIHQTDTYKEKANAYLANFAGHEWLKDVMIDTGKEIQEDIYNDIVKGLDEDVLQLSKSCSRRDFKLCKKVIENNNNEKLLEFNELDRFIDKFFLNIMKAVNNINLEKKSR